MVYSFDVFDSLITRKTATPQGVFAYMQKKLQDEEISEYIRRNFYELRIGAEQAARKFYCDEEVEEVTLQQIYTTMGRTSCLSDEEIQRLISLEEATEEELVIGIEKNIEYLKSLYTNDEKIILISDMYLGAEKIRRMLLKVDSIFRDIPLYVSSEIGKSKYTGKLYEYVEQKESLNKSTWIHLGDNNYSDYEIPQKMGIEAKLLNKKELLPCEEEALRFYPDNVKNQFVIGASANARLFSDLKRDAYKYGTSLGANIVYSYVYWLVERSIQLGIKRLYFIARDGYLLKQIADNIIRVHQYEIQTFYVHGSRKAWRLPSFSQKHFDLSLMIRWDAVRYSNNTDDLTEVFGLSKSQLMEFVPDIYKNVSNEKEMLQLVKELEANETFRELILRNNQENRRLVLQYLEQTIDMSDEHFAFVELIGSGYTQRCLSHLLEDLCEYPVKTFFYHMDGVLDAPMCEFYCYFLSQMENAGIMELLYTAPHGHTIGYRETKDGKVEPVLDNEDEALLTYGLEEYMHGVTDFLHVSADLHSYVQDGLTDVNLSVFYRQYLAEGKDKELLKYIGDMPYKSTGREENSTKYAPGLDKESVRLMMMRNGYRKVYERYQGHNFELSIKRITEKEKEYWRRLHMFPISRLEKRIVLYGAGKFGQALYKELCLDKEHEIVLWVDKNFRELTLKNVQIASVDMLNTVEYDQLVIAILDLNIANEVKEELIARGIDVEKIVTYELAFASDKEENL